MIVEGEPAFDQLTQTASTSNRRNPFFLRSLFGKLRLGAEPGGLPQRLREEGFESIEQLRDAALAEEDSSALPSTKLARERKQVLLDLLQQAEAEEVEAMRRERDRSDLLANIEAHEQIIARLEGELRELADKAPKIQEELLALLGSMTYVFDNRSPHFETGMVDELGRLDRRRVAREAALHRVQGKLVSLREQLGALS